MAPPVVPRWNHSLLPLVGLRVYPVGAGIGGGRALSGDFSGADISGGGYWRAEFDIDAFYPAQHRAWNRAAFRLVGGVRHMLIPFPNDWTGPFPTIDGVPQLYEEVPFSDETTFSDGAPFRQSTVQGYVQGDYSAGDATIGLKMAGPTTLLEGGEVFGITHPTANQRCYGIEEVDSTSVVGHLSFFTVGIRPTLREDVASGTMVEFSHPCCLMKLPFGADMKYSVEDYASMRQSVTLVEASSLTGGP